MKLCTYINNNIVIIKLRGEGELMEIGNIKTMDPYILLSIINTRLRDVYSNLENLCEDLNISIEDILEKLNYIGYFYSAKRNQFLANDK